MRVLVVADDDVARNLMTSAMADRGYQVWSAASWDRALELAVKQSFDLVFCDVVKEGLIGVCQAIASAVEQRRFMSRHIEVETEMAVSQDISGSTSTVATVMNQMLPNGELPTLDELEASYLLRVLSAVSGNKSRAAQILGVDRKTLYRMIVRQAGGASERASCAPGNARNCKL